MKYFSRKGAKAKNSLKRAAALCVFAPLREKLRGLELDD
jgi:hypothetical protein